MARSSHCPDGQTLRLFLLGKASAAETKRIEQHVLRCARCRNILENLLPHDTRVEATKQSEVQAPQEAGSPFSEKILEDLAPLFASKAAPGEGTMGGHTTVSDALSPTSARLPTVGVPTDTALPPSQAAEVEWFCERFLEAWKRADPPPQSEEYLRDFTEPVYSVLCTRLLAIELAYRRRRGERPTLVEYRRRFPGHVHLLPPAAFGEDAEPIPEGTTEDLWDFLAPPQQCGELGRLGSYGVRALLGAGGMGVVFRAEDARLHRSVALKILKPGLAASDSARRRFLREAQGVAAIEHDNIVSVYQVDEYRSIPFLAMPLLKGETLAARLKREGKLPVSEVARLGRETAEGLAAAHARLLIHRDVKPGNIWLEADTGRVKLLDFGLARTVGDDLPVTGPGAVMGTPCYMAPEQARGDELDVRCDLFSLGAVLYQASTGTLPFRQTTPSAALEWVHPTAPHDLDPQIPSALSDLVMALLAKDRAERPPSACAVGQALKAIEHEADVERWDPSLRPASAEEVADPLRELETPSANEPSPIPVPAPPEPWQPAHPPGDAGAFPPPSDLPPLCC